MWPLVVGEPCLKTQGALPGLETQVIVFEVMRPLSCAQFCDSVFGVGIEHLSQELCGYQTGVCGLGLGRSQFLNRRGMGKPSPIVFCNGLGMAWERKPDRAEVTHVGSL